MLYCALFCNCLSFRLNRSNLFLCDRRHRRCSHKTEHLSHLRPNFLNCVTFFRGESGNRDLCTSQRLIDKQVPPCTIFTAMGLVIQFHHADHRQVRCRTDDKVQMLLVDPVQGRHPFAVGQPLCRFDDIAEPDLAKQLVPTIKGLLQDTEERALCRSEKGVAPFECKLNILRRLLRFQGCNNANGDNYKDKYQSNIHCRKVPSECLAVG